MAEGAGLLNQYTGNCIEGSNPFPSATSYFLLIFYGRLGRLFSFVLLDFLRFLIVLGFFRLVRYCSNKWYLMWYLLWH